MRNKMLLQPCVVVLSRIKVTEAQATDHGLARVKDEIITDCRWSSARGHSGFASLEAAGHTREVNHKRRGASVNSQMSLRPLKIVLPRIKVEPGEDVLEGNCKRRGVCASNEMLEAREIIIPRIKVEPGEYLKVQRAIFGADHVKSEIISDCRLSSTPCQINFSIVKEKSEKYDCKSSVPRQIHLTEQGETAGNYESRCSLSQEPATSLVANFADGEQLVGSSETAPNAAAASKEPPSGVTAARVEHGAAATSCDSRAPVSARHDRCSGRTEAGDNAGLVDSSPEQSRELQFSCSLCSARFPKKKLLLLHRSKHERKASFTCSECLKIFTFKESLKRHIHSYCGKKRFSCSICPSFFTVKNELKQHMSVHMCEKPFSCNVCEAKFNSIRNLKSHMRIHTNDKPYSCSLCKAKFKLKSYLKIHSSVHSSEKPFSCNVCSARFKSTSSLQVHIRIHTGYNPFSCNICDAKFRKKAHLISHIHIHTGERPFTCTVCEAKFMTYANLQIHSRIHTGEKPFTCSVCKANFSQKNSLKIHLWIHSGEKPFSCSLCSYKCRTKQVLQRHFYTHTGEKPFSYSKCKAKFSLRSKIKTCPHSCN
ncbi:oocyte zinc finger protein XlCOF6-like isoform X2 [Bacillus rossius redtenbacheri]|uniref:oocyte zinc finger protein XlCOF6-like isoform X2 n=1 Tax=Bacillus rossius redtenbacheri TaxID=93214 RepID=UPI002FDE31B2